MELCYTRQEKKNSREMRKTMSKQKNTSSYLLGKFVFYVQSMEETMPNVSPKGSDWGAQILPLFLANLDSTLQMMEKNLSTLPQSATLATGETLTRGDLQEIVNQIDFKILSDGQLEGDFFLKGYENQPLTPEKPAEPAVNEDSQSHLLGVFLGTLFALEKATTATPILPQRNHGEDSFLLFQINFNTALELTEKSISALPQTEEVYGKGVSISALKQAYQPLNKEILSTTPLVQGEFVHGFQQVLDKYLSS